MLKAIKTIAKYGPSGFQAATAAYNFASVKPYVVDPFNYQTIKSLPLEKVSGYVKDHFTGKEFVEQVTQESAAGDLGMVLQHEFAYESTEYLNTEKVITRDGTLFLTAEYVDAITKGAQQAARELKIATGTEFVVSTGGVFEFVDENGGKFVSNTNIVAGPEGSIAVDKRFAAKQDKYPHKLGERVGNDPHAMLVIFVQEIDGSFNEVKLASQTCLDLTKKQTPQSSEAFRLIVIAPTDGVPLTEYWTSRIMTIVADSDTIKSGVYRSTDGKIERIGTTSHAIWWDYSFRLFKSIMVFEPEKFAEYVLRDNRPEISKRIADGRTYLDLGRHEIPLTMPDSKVVHDQYVGKHPELLRDDVAKSEGIDKRFEDARREGRGETTEENKGTGEAGRHGGEHPTHREGPKGRGK